MLSIIIPARNEEKTIGKLLESIRSQNFDCEIIVGDDTSTDRTAKIAGKYAKVVKGRWKHPGSARNECAKIAKGNYLLFLDADVVLPKDFLNQNFKEFIDRKLVSATTYVKPLSRRIDDWLIHGFGYNFFYFLLQRISPLACGFCIFCRKAIFIKIGGFDRSITLGEDHDLVRKSMKYGRFGMLHGPKINVSVRRLETEGRLKYLLKMIKAALFMTFKGPIRGEIEYTFDQI